MSFYCETHDSLLCHVGQGLCQIPAGERCDVLPIAADWMMERGYRCVRRQGDHVEHRFRPARVFADEQVSP